MNDRKERRRNLTFTILSLSLLTVMAGAAVAPALGVIKEYFAETSQVYVQMIISIPALFIALTNLVFSRLCTIFRSKELLLAGLTLYVLCGSAAGLFDNIFMVLVMRALVGVGVGIIMPMSTGLLSYYYTRDKQDKLMGYSSAANQMGGVVATLASGALASISWRISFLVYLMGLISVVLVMLFLPNEKIGEQASNGEKNPIHKGKRNFLGGYALLIISMFMLMFTFFIYPASFALETLKEGVIPGKYIAVIMAGMDLAAFVGGLSFAYIKRKMNMGIKLLSPALFLVGYLMLKCIGGITGTLVGSVFIGFANGIGIPFIISTASHKAGRAAAITIIPFLSMALYFAQFFTPILLNLIEKYVGNGIEHLPYLIASIPAAILLACSLGIKDVKKEQRKAVATS